LSEGGAAGILIYPGVDVYAFPRVLEMEKLKNMLPAP